MLASPRVNAADTSAVTDLVNKEFLRCYNDISISFLLKLLCNIIINEFTVEMFSRQTAEEHIL